MHKLQIILEISPQKATQNRARQGHVYSCHKDGSIKIEATDGLKPGLFTLGLQDNFPWDDFLKKLCIAWQIGDMEAIPKEFKPQKRIDSIITENLNNEPIQNRLKILATLRKQEFLPALK